MSIRNVLRRRQAFAVFLTLAIVGALLFIPQASAITVTVSGITSGETITVGVVKTLTFTINVESGEVVPIQEIRVYIDSTQYSAPPAGGSLSPSNSIIPSLTLVNPPSGYLYATGYGYGYGFLFGYGYSQPSGGAGYGYGYGYPYGYGFQAGTQIKYQASLNTAYMSLGSHTIRVDVVTGLQPTNVFSSQTITFTVTAAAPVVTTTTTTTMVTTTTTTVAPPASELEALPAEQRAAQLTQMNTTDAARRVEEMSVDKAAEAIRVMSATEAANILNVVNTTRRAELLATLPLNNSVQVTLALKVDKAAEAILVLDVTTAAQLVQSTATTNVTRTAQIVDTMVAVNVVRAATIVEQLPTETVVDLLIEIASLPSTPEKAAALLDSMSLAKSVESVKSLIASNKLQTLAQILTHVSTSRLNDIFKQLTSAERLRTLPYLDTSTQARLKHVKASFTVDSVEVQPGSSVKVRLVLSATQPIPSGTVSFSVPSAFKSKALSVEGLPGESSREDGRLVITKSAAQPSYASASVSFELTVPLNASVSVGQLVSLAVSVDVSDFAVSFETPSTISVTMVKPSVQSIFSALNSYFDKAVSDYTEGRVPLKQDILSLLDFYFRGRVD